MKWLVEEFLNHASNVIRIQRALEQLGIDYLLVKVNQNRTLTVVDQESRCLLDDSDAVLKTFIQDAPIMVYGSKTLADIAQEMGLYPGSFMNEQFEFEVFRQQLGNELLNHTFVVGELQELTPIADTFFVRPTGNTKLFDGKVMTKETFLAWQQAEQQETSRYKGQTIMMSPLQDIQAEYRFFVVNQQLITGSSYKVGNVLKIDAPLPETLWRYTEKIIAQFPLAQAFVVDIAETKQGFKVIEYNNINSSGLYGCDEHAIVQAIQQLII